jgi:hypothetical protein
MEDGDGWSKKNLRESLVILNISTAELNKKGES